MTGWIDLENRSLTGEERSWQHVATTFGIVLRGSPSRGLADNSSKSSLPKGIFDQRQDLPVMASFDIDNSVWVKPCCRKSWREEITP